MSSVFIAGSLEIRAWNDEDKHGTVGIPPGHRLHIRTKPFIFPNTAVVVMLQRIFLRHPRLTTYSEYVSVRRDFIMMRYGRPLVCWGVGCWLHGIKLARAGFLRN